MRGLLVYKLLHHPVQFIRVLRQFTRHMSLRDVLYLLVKPFLGRKSGETPAETLSRSSVADARPRGTSACSPARTPSVTIPARPDGPEGLPASHERRA